MVVEILSSRWYPGILGIFRDKDSFENLMKIMASTSEKQTYAYLYNSYAYNFESAVTHPLA